MYQKEMLKKLYVFAIRSHRLYVANTVLRFLRGDKFNGLDYAFLKFYLGWIYPRTEVDKFFTKNFLFNNNRRR